MQRLTNKKNRVFPGNNSIKYHYFLISISDPHAGHIGAYLVDQAYTGNMTSNKEQVLYNRIQEDCYQRGENTGFHYQIAAAGSRAFCLTIARQNGFAL